jgi:hypothetical protein
MLKKAGLSVLLHLFVAMSCVICKLIYKVTAPSTCNEDILRDWYVCWGWYVCWAPAIKGTVKKVR